MTSHHYAPLIVSGAPAKKSAMEQKIEQILVLAQSNLEKSLPQIQAFNWNKYNKTYTHSFFNQACELWEEKSLSKHAVSELFKTALDSGWDPYQEAGLERAVEDQSQQKSSAAKKARERVKIIASVMSLSSPQGLMCNSFIEFLFCGLGMPDKEAIKIAKNQENFINQVQDSKKLLSFLWGQRWENNLCNSKEEKQLFEYHNWLIQLGAPITQKFINEMRSGLKDLNSESWWNAPHHKKACDLLEEAITQREKTKIMNSIEHVNKNPSVKKATRKM